MTQVMTAATAMTINCARCHDHKLDGIPQEDYYRLMAVFAGLKREKRKISGPALKKFNAEKKRLGDAIDKTQFAIGELQGQGVDLADLVGGGNGFGSGRKGIGLDARTGKMQERNFGDLGNVKPGNYAKCSYDFIDGVFVPAEGETKVSSTNLKATGLPANGGKAWDMIRNGPVASQFSTQWGGVDYNKPGHSMIGLHANAGITFDLAPSAKQRASGNFVSAPSPATAGARPHPARSFGYCWTESSWPTSDSGVTMPCRSTSKSPTTPVFSPSSPPMAVMTTVTTRSASATPASPRQIQRPSRPRTSSAWRNCARKRARLE